MQGARTMPQQMKILVSLLLAVMICPALAQPGQERHRGDHGRTMPPPERRMSLEDRQRLREQVRGGNMTRDEARERRSFEPGRTPEERQRLRRDVQDANRDLEKR